MQAVATAVVVLASVAVAGCAPAPPPPPPTPPQPQPQLVNVEAPPPPSPGTASPPVVDAGSVAKPEEDAGPPAPTPPPAKRERVKLAGACVDPVADTTQRTKGMGPSFEKRIDIDEDGEEDWILTTDADATMYRGYVYLARGTCAHFVGQWEGSQPEALDTPAKGPRDLRSGSPCKVGCCASERTRTYRFDGTAYKKISEKVITNDCSKSRPTF